MAMNGSRLTILSARIGDRRGQMTMEMMAVLPVAIVIAVIAVNALVFFGDCASFDRAARSAIRVYATSPSYGVQAGQSQASIRSAVQAEIGGEFTSVEVTYGGVGAGLTRYTVTLDYAPNLFGMGMRETVLGVQLPHLKHSTSLVVDTYKPGIFFE